MISQPAAVVKLVVAWLARLSSRDKTLPPVALLLLDRQNSRLFERTNFTDKNKMFRIKYSIYEKPMDKFSQDQISPNNRLIS